MKRFILLLCLCCSYGWGYAHEKDSLSWEVAEQEMQAGNYEKACSLYVDLSLQLSRDYQKINSQTVEDLRKVYSIDELELQNSIQQNHLLRLGCAAGLVLIFIFIICVFYIRKQNKQLVASRRELRRAKELAEESIRNKSLFLSNMSHEIKTPLSALSGFSELLTMPGLDDNTRIQCNEIIQLNSELLLKLINDVVDISCLDVANMKFNIQPCEVVAFCRSVMKTLSAIKQTEAEILFETELDALEIETDTSRLQQLLINLLVNATKFTKEGTITLKVEKEKDDAVRFSVTDTGCGIPQEKQKDIFSRFEKLNEKAQGTGLGLSICQLIIKRLGGEIWIDSEYDKGARFVFVHPLKQEVR